MSKEFFEKVKQAMKLPKVKMSAIIKSRRAAKEEQKVEKTTGEAPMASDDAKQGKDDDHVSK